MTRRTKNIIILSVVCIVTLGVLFAALKINRNRLDNIKNKSYIDGYLTEIKYDSIDDFVVENPNAIIFVSNSDSKESSDFEKVFAKVIAKYNLENSVYYINIHNVNLVDQFYQNAPEIIVYKDSNVSEVLDASTLKEEEAIIKVLKERSIINE